jgi:hypothetical protein
MDSTTLLNIDPKATMAAVLAARFGNDGYRNVERLDKLCARLCMSKKTQYGAARYEFADTSSIVFSGAYWDIGFAGTGCFCWASVGHNETCEHAGA